VVLELNPFMLFGVFDGHAFLLKIGVG
jgi:hypothetical protein